MLEKIKFKCYNYKKHKEKYMKKFWAEFKKFVAKGNIVDLALAVIIGSAFNKIVNSLVNDVIMPLISLAVGGADVSDWKWVITPAEYDANGAVVVAETALKYGSFIQTIIDFMIIALTLFIAFKIFNYSKKKMEMLTNNLAASTEQLKKKLKKKKKKGQVEETEVVEEVKVEPAPVEPPPPTKEEIMISLLTEIRDNLTTKK